MKIELFRFWISEVVTIIKVPSQRGRRKSRIDEIEEPLNSEEIWKLSAKWLNSVPKSSQK